MNWRIRTSVLRRRLVRIMSDAEVAADEADAADSGRRADVPLPPPLLPGLGASKLLKLVECESSMEVVMCGAWGRCLTRSALPSSELGTTNAGATHCSRSGTSTFARLEIESTAASAPASPPVHHN